MTPEELQNWLDEHVDLIVEFMDYEPTIDSEEELVETLGFWLGNESVDLGGHRFVHLGIDGMGSQFAVWIRPGAEAPHPVVYFGSEGGRGVLTRAPLDWAQAIAYAPGIDEYPEEGEPLLDPESNWMLDPEEDPDMAEAARAAQREYREEVIEAFGNLPDLSVLVSDLDELNAEFEEWIEARVG